LEKNIFSKKYQKNRKKIERKKWDRKGEEGEKEWKKGRKKRMREWIDI
jgi:hypothetical protein